MAEIGSSGQCSSLTVKVEIIRIIIGKADLAHVRHSSKSFMYTNFILVTTH